MLTLAALMCSPIANSQETEVNTIGNYAFSVFVGTGVYKIGDRDIFVLRAPLAFTLREADYETKTIGYRLLAPVSIGFTNYENWDEFPDVTLDDVQALTFAPGIQADIPVTSNWLIRPFGQAGLGWDTKSSDNTFVLGAGARTRAWFLDDKKLLIGGELLWAANDQKDDNEADTTFSRWAFGAEYKWQTDWAPFGYRVSWHPRTILWWYGKEVTFLPPPEEQEITRSVEIGLSFGISPYINIFGYKFSQAGIGYEFGPNFEAVKFFTKFPF